MIANQSPGDYEDVCDVRDVVPTRIALIDAKGIIVAVNKDWMGAGAEAGATPNRVAPGMNYLDMCRRASSSSAVSKKALVGIQEVLSGKKPFFTMDYACDTNMGTRRMRMGVTRIVCGTGRTAIACADITDLQRSRERDFARLQQFARRLINAQEEERQRIAREIHDDLGGRIAMLSLSVRQSMNECTGELEPMKDDFNKVLQGIIELSNSLRSLSHSLHPPPLRYLGITAALKSLQSDFEKAHPIRINLDIPAELPRLPDDVQLCLFRISQECLQNIAKHSRADTVKMVLEYTPEEVRLTVSDCGCGFNPSKAVRKGGLGLLSMEERALSIRGRLIVKSSPGAGTDVHLSVPIQKHSAAVTVQ